MILQHENSLHQSDTSFLDIRGTNTIRMYLSYDFTRKENHTYMINIKLIRKSICKILQIYHTISLNIFKRDMWVIYYHMILSLIICRVPAQCKLQNQMQEYYKIEGSLIITIKLHF